MDKFNMPNLSGIDIHKLMDNMQPVMPQIPLPKFPEIAFEDTVWYEQQELLKKQINQQNTHNELLTQNYNKLQELFELQKSEYDAAKGELAKSKRMNRIMLVIAIVAMLGAIASPLVTWLVTLKI